MIFEDEMNFGADHEARGIAIIVSKGRPQAVRTANRIARANNGGVNCNPGHASRAARKRRAEKRNERREALDRIITNGTTGCHRARPGEGESSERASALVITGNRDTATGLDTAGDQLVRRAVAHALPQGNEMPTVVRRSRRALRHATVLWTRVRRTWIASAKSL